MKIRHGVIATVITDVDHGLLGLQQQRAGVAYADLVEEINICFLRALFKIITEGRYAQTGDGGNLCEGYFLFKIVNGESVDAVDAGGIFGVVDFYFLCR